MLGSYMNDCSRYPFNQSNSRKASAPSGSTARNLMEYSLLKAWKIRVPEPSSQRQNRVEGRRSDGFVILHPRQGPPMTAAPVWKQSCRPRCTLSPTSPTKQVVLETSPTGKIGTAWSSNVSPSRRPTLRHPGTCKRYDSMKGIIEHDICKSTTQYHALRHGKPTTSNTNKSTTTSREQLRHIREGASGDKVSTLHLAERLMVCDTDVAMKRQPAARPPWPKEYVANYLTAESELALSDAKWKVSMTEERQQRFDAHCDLVAQGRDGTTADTKRMEGGPPSQVQTRSNPPPFKSKHHFRDKVNSWKVELGGDSEESMAAASEDAALFKTQQMLLRSHKLSGAEGMFGKRRLPLNNHRGLTWQRTIPRQPKATSAVMGIA
ncbi:hypothetical protein H310_06679 [Aphanomyces invadans]|uniref:Uncharacterized protein n=1 Tax=Aphanomyces invadans TaxID=157072 RepID=A0A024U475_9STRA|nr:hypothetical protein H310_06679 [Aphanomyces invadans]ETW01049.1 hypothetical protein H310_06679 [Aphanomyces invadans]|eukprot:XP_008870047.1 hypothetical protein H310_06679 [Aphanomyces invadans]